VVILEHKSIICAGYSAVMHIHTCAEEVSIKVCVRISDQELGVTFLLAVQALLCTIDKKTGEKSKERPRFIKQDQIAILRLEVVAGLICLETFKDFPQMGRFTLRDEGANILHDALWLHSVIL
jgi:peptide chain release factor subunit 3